MQIRLKQNKKSIEQDFYSASKETTHESSKVAEAEKSFLHSACY